MDCLSFLREFIIKKKAILLLDSGNQACDDISTATDFSFDRTAFPRSELTRYHDPSNNQDFFPLDSIYFAYLKRELPHSEYFQESMKRQIKVVTLTIKRDLFDYLSGVTNESSNVAQPQLGTMIQCMI